MTRSKLFVGSQTPAEAAVKSVGFVVVFCACLIAERFLITDNAGHPLALLSAGALIGAMAVAHNKWWQHIVGMALLLRFGFDLMMHSGDVAPALVTTLVMTFCSVLFVLGVTVLTPHRRRHVLTSELFRASGLILIGASALYGTLLALLTPGVSFEPLTVLMFGMAFIVGAAVMCACIICFGLPFGEPPPASLRTSLWITFATLMFLTSISLGFNDFPDFTSANLAYLNYLILLCALPILFSIAMHASSSIVSLNLLGMVVVASFSWVFCIGFFADEFTPANIFEWQVAVAGITYLGLMAAAVASELRYVHDKQQLQSLLANALLDLEGVEENQDSVVAVFESLGQFTDADECRLYKFATASGLMTPAAVWRRDGKERAPAKAVNAVPVRWFHRELIEGNPVFFRHSTAVHGEAPKLLETFELPIHVELLAQPVQTHLETGAVVMLMSYDRRALMLRDTSELLTTIGSFFATEWARATADKELRRYERRLRELATNLTESDERVRRHTSVDLHDGLIQQLAVARMKLGELRYRRVSSPDTIDNLTAIIDDTLATTRRIVQKLSPSVLYELGLAPGIQTLCDKATETGGIPVELTEEGDRRSLSEPLMVSLYEVVRELIDNSQKHSGGQNIWVHIVWGQESLRYISVSDDGVHERWWSEEASSSEGLGLLSNSERLRSFGFTTLFGERAGGGTKATVITDAGRYNRGNVAS